MKPEEHTNHCAENISLQKQTHAWRWGNFMMWVICDISIFHIIYKKGPQTPCWKTHSCHLSLLHVHLPRQKHHVSELEHAERQTYSHRHLNPPHPHHLPPEPETLLWIQPGFSSPPCITATSPKPCSSAWFIWAHFVKINTKEGNPLGWLNNKKFGSRTPSHLCAQLILHHAAATFILFCQKKVRNSFHHKYLELANYSKTNFSWVQSALQERRLKPRTWRNCNHTRDRGLPEEKGPTQSHNVYMRCL